MKLERVGIAVRGAVQGVGFRPFVYRLAGELQIVGWVLNSSQGVSIEAEGPPGSLQRFLSRLQKELPARAVVQSFESWQLEPVGDRAFEIRESAEGGSKTALILPDLATCADCLREILDPTDRRFRYPFTNCTNCGPRFSIITALPYDRANTSMKKFLDVRRLRAGIWRPGRSSLSCRANGLPPLRTTPAALEFGRRSCGGKECGTPAGGRRNSRRSDRGAQGPWRVSIARRCA